MSSLKHSQGTDGGPTQALCTPTWKYMTRYPAMPEKAMVPMTLASRMIWNERMRNTCVAGTVS